LPGHHRRPVRRTLPHRRPPSPRWGAPDLPAPVRRHVRPRIRFRGSPAAIPVSPGPDRVAAVAAGPGPTRPRGPARTRPAHTVGPTPRSGPGGAPRRLPGWFTRPAHESARLWRQAPGTVQRARACRLPVAHIPPGRVRRWSMGA